MDDNYPKPLRAIPIPEPFSQNRNPNDTPQTVTLPQSPSSAQSENIALPVSLSDARNQIDHSISPLELQIFLAQQFASAALRETSRAGHLSLTAQELARAAATINNTVLPYTHARLSPADSSDNRNQTESMLNEIALQRARRQQQLLTEK